jgi:membrane protein implicated in regulation of membrane protease activity
MDGIYLYCAAIGGALLVIQFVMLALGGGADHADAHPSVDGSLHDAAFLKYLSLQTLAAFATFFGLAGLATSRAGWSTTTTTITAICAGVLALWSVARATAWMLTLQSTGNVDLANAIGQEANVYLRIPPAGDGNGRVMLTVQGRRVEAKAISQSGEIATGERVRVMACAADDLLLVDRIQA